jgi:hypothetical protein
MDTETLYYLWAALLLVVNALLWFTTFFTLPGNWGIVGAAALFAWLAPHGEGQGISWTAVGVGVGLAALGEMVELVAGSAAAAQQGASRRAMVLALVGTVAGSVCGAIVGVPIPVIGPIVAALGGGALGAFAGAYLGETWKGRTSAERMAVGKGALVGRLLGTVGKAVLGAVIVVIVTFDAFV